MLGPQGPHKCHQILERVAFDIELATRPKREQLGQIVYIPRPDVAFIRARMDGDPVCAGAQANVGGACEGRNAQMARIAHQGDLVQIDGKRGKFHKDWMSIIICRVRNVPTPQW